MTRPALTLAPQSSPDDRVATAIASWLDAKRERSGSEKTLVAYQRAIHHFRRHCRERSLDLDSPPQAIAHIAEKWAAAGQVAAATFNQRLAILSSFYAYCERYDLLSVGNPAQRIERRPVQAYGAVQALEYQEVARRLARIERGTLRGKRDYALLVIALTTGRRCAELVGLRMGEVQRGDVVTLTWSRCKGGKTMHDALAVPVAAALLDYLKALYGPHLAAAPDDPVWINLSRHQEGQPLTTRSVARICKAHLGITRVHRLRHTFARAMEDAGAKLSDIQARLGHSSLATTSRYLTALRSAENPQAGALASLFGVGEG